MCGYSLRGFNLKDFLDYTFAIIANIFWELILCILNLSEQVALKLSKERKFSCK
jgi:hypothetical protein